jgi:hypothetical protein
MGLRLYASQRASLHPYFMMASQLSPELSLVKALLRCAQPQPVRVPR